MLVLLVPNHVLKSKQFSVYLHQMILMLMFFLKAIKQ